METHTGFFLLLTGVSQTQEAKALVNAKTCIFHAYMVYVA